MAVSANSRRAYHVVYGCREFPMRTFNKRTMVMAGTAAAVVATASIAYAYYAATVSGSGSGSAATANTTIADVQPITSGTGAPSAISDLVPGTSKTATVTLKNTNTFAVRIPATTVSVTGMTGTMPADCDTINKAGITGSGSVPAQSIIAGGTVAVTVTVSMADSTTLDQSACNNKSFNLTYTAAPTTP